MIGGPIQRRSFISLLGGTAAAWPMAARAQQRAIPVIGYLHPGTPEQSAHLVAAFRNGLSEAGYEEGRNAAIEYRFSQNDQTRLPQLAADLVRRRVAVIATGTASATLAAKVATKTIPVVFVAASDPVQLGLVASLNRPGGNITGINSMSTELGAKRLGLLRELLPQGVRFGVLTGAGPAGSSLMIPDILAAASAVGCEIEILTVSTADEIDTAFGSVAQRKRCAKADRRTFDSRGATVPAASRTACHAGGISSSTGFFY
jgi:ABC-type uncharacterized transport system substrate-binding protein